MRYILLIALTVATLFFGVFIIRQLYFSKTIIKTHHEKTAPNKGKDHIALRMQARAKQISRYAKIHHYNTQHYCLIDMSLLSGEKRFFLYDGEADSMLLSGLVTHGSGTLQSDTIQYSNSKGSNCSSLGRYKIGKPYYGKFGLAYKLYGLDKTNSNAFNRFVVLHAHPCVPDQEVAPLQICRSWGCPTISPAFLNQLKIYLVLC